MASQKHRESASYLYDDPHTSSGNKGNNARDRSNRYSNRHKVCGVYVWCVYVYMCMSVCVCACVRVSVRVCKVY